MAVRDGVDYPLTLLQLQKKVWHEVKQISNRNILTELSNMNVVGANNADYLSEEA